MTLMKTRIRWKEGSEYKIIQGGSGIRGTVGKITMEKNKRSLNRVTEEDDLVKGRQAG